MVEAVGCIGIRVAASVECQVQCQVSANIVCMIAFAACAHVLVGAGVRV